MKNIFISIVNYNGFENTAECLSSIEKLQLKNINLSVVVVDNASTDDSVAKLAKFKVQSSPLLPTQSGFEGQVKYKVIVNKYNSGFAGGHNRAIKYALENNADYILILNNDTFLDKNLLQELVETHETVENTGIVVPKIYFAKGYEFHKDKYKKEQLGKVLWYAGGIMDWENVIGINRGVDEFDIGQYDTAADTDLATGCCMLVKRSIFESIGLLDEKYFLYYEDTDFNERVARAGNAVYYQPKAVLWHKNAGSTGGSGSELQDYFITRNRLKFGMHYAPARTKIALFRESARLLREGRDWQKKGVRDFYMRRFGKGSFNV